MALSQELSSWTDSGATQVVNGTDGNPQTVPVYTPVHTGNWIYTNASGGVSVIGDASLTQPQAEAARDNWLAAGGIL